MRIALTDRVRFALHAIAHTPVARLVPTPLTERARRRILGTDGADLLRVTGLLGQAGVPYLVGGGWGVDLLAGIRSRRHHDIDVIIDDDPHTKFRACEALATAGYEVVDECAVGGALMPIAVVLRDGLGHTIELLPVVEPFAGTTASFEGREISCLAPEAQLQLHEGYEPRPIDRSDVALLCQRFGLVAPPGYETPSTAVANRRQQFVRWLRPAGPSALIIPVAEAEPAVAELRRLHDPAAQDGLPAHVTVLYPFLPPRALDDHVIERLGDLAAAAPAFTFELGQFGRFPGVLYLAPEPGDPFVALTEAVESQWPNCPPYRGEFDQIIPHLTVAEGALDATESVVSAVSGSLPISANAAEIWLMVQERGGHWTVRDRFSLGGGGTARLAHNRFLATTSARPGECRSGRRPPSGAAGRKHQRNARGLHVKRSDPPIDLG